MDFYFSNEILHLMYQKQNETITINGKTYKPIKEGKKKSNPHILKEIYGEDIVIKNFTFP